jgi:UPF0716 protein FxsA
MAFLLLIGFLIADIVLSIWVGKQVGGWMLLLWFVMAFFVGRQIMKGASKELTPQLQQAQMGGTVDPNANFLTAICQALAGFLFILPSVLTDVMAVLLLLPPVQKGLQGKMQQAFASRGANLMKMGGFGRTGQSPFGNNPFSNKGEVFDGQATEVKPEPASMPTPITSSMRVTTATKKPIQTSTEVKGGMKVTTRIDKNN